MFARILWHVCGAVLALLACVACVACGAVTFGVRPVRMASSSPWQCQVQTRLVSIKHTARMQSLHAASQRVAGARPGAGQSLQPALQPSLCSRLVRRHLPVCRASSDDEDPYVVLKLDKDKATQLDVTKAYNIARSRNRGNAQMLQKIETAHGKLMLQAFNERLKVSMPHPPSAAVSQHGSSHLSSRS